MNFFRPNSILQIRIAVFLFLVISIHASLGQGWIQKNNFPGIARYAAASFVINNKAYLGTGYTGVKTLDDLWEYDPNTDSWTQKAVFPSQQRYSAVSFAVNGKGYIGLGSTSYGVYNFVKDLWEYDPLLNSWARKSDFPAKARYTLASFVINGKAYIGTGWDQTTAYFKDFWRYDPINDSWKQISDFGGTARNSTAFFSIKDKGYVGLGTFTSSVYSDFWEYDPLTDAWSQKASFPGTPRFAGACFVYNDIGYIGLGSSSYPTPTFLNDFWKYIPQTNSWDFVGVFPGSKRYEAESFVIGCKAYLTTGWDDLGMQNDFWELPFCSPPVSNFKVSDSLICSVAGEACVSFTDLTTGNPTSWKWYFPGASPDSSIEQNPKNICYAQYGKYTATLMTTNDGGSNTIIKKSVVISPPPTAPMISIRNDTLFCNPSSGFSFQWYYNIIPIANAKDSFLVPYIGQTGNYYVLITDTDGCSSYSQPFLFTEVIQFSRSREFSAYSDQGVITVSINQQIMNGIIRIFSLSGNMVIETRPEGNETNIKIKHGIYLLQYIGDNFNFVKKISVN